MTSSNTSNCSRQLIMQASEYIEAIKLIRKHDKSFSKNEAISELNIAILGEGTFYQLGTLLLGMLSFYGIKGHIFYGEYDNYEAEILSENKPLLDFNPDIIYIQPSYNRTIHQLRTTQSIQNISDIVHELTKLAKFASNKYSAAVTIFNFFPRPFDYDSNLSAISTSSSWNHLRIFNSQLVKYSKGDIGVIDVERLAACSGYKQAFSVSDWLRSKQSFSFDFQVKVAQEMCLNIVLLRSSSKKLVVIDCDNTIWGGVIGDDGINGIDIGLTSSTGEGFLEVQKYLKRLSKRGFILGVCSKNEFDNVIDVFDSHPDMVLRKDDIVNFKVNWNPKSDNIKEMASELNLGVDSIVFLDDNPAELELVKQFLPEVDCILASPDPVITIRRLSNSTLFHQKSLTEEDGRKTLLYKQEEKRNKLKTSTLDYNHYLQSLEMVATISRFNTTDAPRIAQLINKSNQFNLTTIRRTEGEIIELIASSSHHCFSLRLFDKFGDHGLVAVVICALSDNKNIEIETLIMSCRVLKRSVENVILDHIVKYAEKDNYEIIIGQYSRTKKNKLVENLYRQLGFAETDNSTNCTSFFSLKTNTYTKPTLPIKQEITYDI